MTSLPSYIDPELWSAFVETRKAMRGVVFSDAAQKLVIRKLMRMHSEGWDVNASLEKSAVYGYRGVFEVSRVNPVDLHEQQAKHEEIKVAKPSPEILARLAAVTQKITAK